MASSNQRILMKRGRISLIESANPSLGLSYAVIDGSLGIWRGESLTEAQAQFSEAVMAEVRQPGLKPVRGR